MQMANGVGIGGLFVITAPGTLLCLFLGIFWLVPQCRRRFFIDKVSANKNRFWSVMGVLALVGAIACALASALVLKIQDNQNTAHIRCEEAETCH